MVKVGKAPSGDPPARAALRGGLTALVAIGMVEACGSRTTVLDDFGVGAAGSSGNAGSGETTGSGGSYGGDGAYTGGTGGSYGGNFNPAGYGGSYGGTYSAGYGGKAYGGYGGAYSAGYGGKAYGGYGGTYGGYGGKAYGGYGGSYAGAGFGGVGGGAAGSPAVYKACSYACNNLPGGCPPYFQDKAVCVGECTTSLPVPGCEGSFTDLLYCLGGQLNPNAMCKVPETGGCLGPGCTDDALAACPDAVVRYELCIGTPPPPSCGSLGSAGPGFCSLQSFCAASSYYTYCSPSSDLAWQCNCYQNDNYLYTVYIGGASDPCLVGASACGFP